MAKINENTLWKYFSIYIRTRDADSNGVGRCITCGAFRHWTDADCGHGIPRQWKGTKYNEQNNHLQCKVCNGFEGGAREKYKEAVDRKYGAGTWDKLVVLSKKFVKWSQFEIDLMAQEYKKLGEEMKKKKNL